MNTSQAYYRSFLIKASANSQPGIAIVIAIALFDMIGIAAIVTSILLVLGPLTFGNLSDWTIMQHTVTFQAGMSLMIMSRIISLVHYLSEKSRNSKTPDASDAADPTDPVPETKNS